jgi:hypothetical protein
MNYAVGSVRFTLLLQIADVEVLCSDGEWAIVGMVKITPDGLADFVAGDASCQHSGTIYDVMQWLNSVGASLRTDDQ